VSGAAVFSRKLAGTCSNGFERGRGARYHAVPLMGDDYTSRALCGAKPGRRSAGWQDPSAHPVTCPRCLARIAKAAEVSS
jgi:hypothetical protein